MEDHLLFKAYKKGEFYLASLQNGPKIVQKHKFSDEPITSIITSQENTNNGLMSPLVIVQSKKYVSLYESQITPKSYLPIKTK